MPAAAYSTVLDERAIPLRTRVDGEGGDAMEALARRQAEADEAQRQRAEQQAARKAAMEAEQQREAQEKQSS